MNRSYRPMTAQERRKPRPRLGLRAAWFSVSGASALEFAILAPILATLVLNVYDFTVYISRSMQVANAAQMGAQAVRETCDSANQPATKKCSFDAAVGAAIHGTSLGTSVVLNGAVTEAYYCVGTDGTLQNAGSVNNPPPANCSAFGGVGVTPGDYVKVSVEYPYSPLFPYSLAGFLPTPIRKSSMIRID